jgi:hypothetical protein
VGDNEKMASRSAFHNHGHICYMDFNCLLERLAIFFSDAPEAEHAPFETIIFGTIWLIAGIWILLDRAKSK